MPTDRNRSAFAVQVADLHADPPRSRPVFGFCVHTSGRGLYARAARMGVSLLEAALAYYASSARSTGYVIDLDGSTYQISADDRRVPHVGVESEERAEYLAGRWQSVRLSADVAARWRARNSEPVLAVSAVARWQARWPLAASPQHLFPGPSANDVYVGCELLPLKTANPSTGWWFTASQHLAAGRLAADVARRHGFPQGWQESSRLLGHEDLDAFARWDSGGGWDPGALRDKPRLDWHLVRVAAVNTRLIEAFAENGRL